MRTIRIKEIAVPLQEGLALTPSVCFSDKVIDALKLMSRHNLRQIIVIHNEQPIGMVRIEDALLSLGLQEDGS